jgi:hypothetical protein
VTHRIRYETIFKVNTLEYEKNNTVTWYGIVLRMDEDRIWQTILNTQVNENSQTILISGWEPVKKAVTQK